MRYTHIFNILFVLFFPFTIISTFAENMPVQSIDQAYSRLLESNSTIKAQELRTEGLKALIDQANLIPNPQLSLESENFGGDLGGYDQTENTVTLSQKIELGGKRSARTSLAESKTKVFEANVKLKLANIVRDVQIAYLKVLLSQKLHELAIKQEEFAKNVLITAKEKVAHGGILAGEQTKAKISYQVISIDKQIAKNSLDQSKRLLASFWNGTANDVGELIEFAGSENKKLILTPLDETLTLKAFSSQINFSKKNLRNEEAQIIPDITFSGGYRRFEQVDNDAFVASISLPLPLFNRNKGRVTQAKREIIANEEEYLRAKTLVKAKLNNLLQTREVLLRERATIAKHLLPDSNQALSEFREAYRLGRVGYLDLIDSQKVYFGVKKREAQNIFNLRSNEANIKSITGQILKTVKEVD